MHFHWSFQLLLLSLVQKKVEPILVCNSDSLLYRTQTFNYLRPEQLIDAVIVKGKCSIVYTFLYLIFTLLNTTRVSHLTLQTQFAAVCSAASLIGALLILLGLVYTSYYCCTIFFTHTECYNDYTVQYCKRSSNAV